MKEYGISTLVLESAADNKSDYINRWLLHRLRISPLEVELLYTIFSATLKVKNARRWQEDVLYYWSRDGANKPKEEYDGLVTTRDALIIDDPVASENLNSALGRPDRPGSDPGDSPKHRGHQKPRSLQSVS
jgi:nuclear transport factor 2 (NTF2) superfamily protein